MSISNYQQWMQAVKEAIHWQKYGGYLSKEAKTARRILRRLGLTHQKNIVKVASASWKYFRSRYGII